MLKIRLQNTTILLLLILLLIACENVEEPTIVVSNGDKTAIEFTPQRGKWNKTTPPDSFVVKITRGFPPYIITERPLFGIALIKNNQLIIYPYPIFSNEDNSDYINIRDNNGNVKSFLINFVD